MKNLFNNHRPGGGPMVSPLFWQPEFESGRSRQLIEKETKDCQLKTFLIIIEEACIVVKFF